MAQLKDDWEKIPTRGGKETVQTLRARRIFATLCLVALVTMFIYLFVPKSQLVRVVVQHYSSGGVDVGGIDAFAKPPINDWMTDTASKNVEIHTSTSTSADRSGSVPNSKDSLLDVVSAQCNSAGEFDTVLVLLSGTAELRLESPTFVGASDDQIKNVLKILRTVGKEGLRILCLDLGESVPRRNLATYQVAIENLLKSSVNTDGKAKPHEVAVILSNGTSQFSHFDFESRTTFFEARLKAILTHPEGAFDSQQKVINEKRTVKPVDLVQSLTRYCQLNAEDPAIGGQSQTVTLLPAKILDSKFIQNFVILNFDPPKSEDKSVPVPEPKSQEPKGGKSNEAQPQDSKQSASRRNPHPIPTFPRQPVLAFFQAAADGPKSGGKSEVEPKGNPDGEREGKQPPARDPGPDGEAPEKTSDESKTANKKPAAQGGAKVPTPSTEPWIQAFEEYDRLLSREPGKRAPVAVTALELGPMALRSYGRLLANKHREQWLARLADAAGLPPAAVPFNPKDAQIQLRDLADWLNSRQRIQSPDVVKLNDGLQQLIAWGAEFTQVNEPEAMRELRDFQQRFDELPADAQQKVAQVLNDAHLVLFLIPELMRWLELQGDTKLVLNSDWDDVKRIVDNAAETIAVLSRTDGAIVTLSERGDLEPVTIAKDLRENREQLEAHIRQTVARLENALRKSPRSAPARHAAERFLSTLLPTAAQRRRLCDAITQPHLPADPLAPPAKADDSSNGPALVFNPSGPLNVKDVNKKWDDLVTESIEKQFRPTLNPEGVALPGIPGEWQYFQKFENVDPDSESLPFLAAILSPIPDQQLAVGSKSVPAYQVRNSPPPVRLPRLESFRFDGAPRVVHLSPSHLEEVFTIIWECNVQPTDLKWEPPTTSKGFRLDELKNDAKSKSGTVNFRIRPREGSTSDGRPETISITAVWGPGGRYRRKQEVTVDLVPKDVVQLVLESPEGAAKNLDPASLDQIWIYPERKTPVRLAALNRYSEDVRIDAILYRDSDRNLPIATVSNVVVPKGKTARLQWKEQGAPAGDAGAKPPAAAPAPDATWTLDPKSPMLWARITIRKVDDNSTLDSRMVEIPVRTMRPLKFVSLDPSLETGKFQFTLTSRRDRFALPRDQMDNPVQAEVMGLDAKGDFGAVIGGKVELTLPAASLRKGFLIPFNVANVARGIVFEYDPDRKQPLGINQTLQVHLLKLSAVLEEPLEAGTDKKTEIRYERGENGKPWNSGTGLTQTPAAILERKIDAVIRKTSKLKLTLAVDLPANDDENDTPHTIEIGVEGVPSSFRPMNPHRNETIHLAQTPVDGELVFVAKAVDWELELPFLYAERLVRLVARIDGMDTGLATILVDSTPPKVLSASLDAKGETLSLSVKAEDAVLGDAVEKKNAEFGSSNVEQVEIEIQKPDGSYGEKKLVAKIDNKTQRWIARVERKEFEGSDKARVRVTAIDYAGNRSIPAKPFELSLPKISASPKPQGTLAVKLSPYKRGTAEAENWVQSPPGEKPTTPNEKGEYVFDKLAPGKYTIQFQYTTSSPKTLMNSQPTQVEILSGEVTRVTLILKEPKK